MLIRPSVLPDEIDRGYLGRVMRVNGLSDKQGILRALRVWSGLPADGGTGPRTGTIALLSQLANIPLYVFVARHTTLPWRRAITWHKTHIDHGGEHSESIVAGSGIRLAREAAYFCKECVADDQARYGFSFWRRSHQLPGCQRCAEHLTALIRVPDQWAFLKSPAIFLHAETAQMLPELSWVDHPLVQRFYAIAEALMERTQPLNSVVLRQILHHKGRELNLQICGGEVRRPLLSDIVRRSFPSEWLKEVFPAVYEKREGELLNQLDGVFFFANGASSVEAYFLAMAILFESVDDVLLALEQCEAYPTVRGTRSAMDVPESDALIEYYIEAAGRYSAVATRCNASVFVVSKRLMALGLPNFSSRKQGAGLIRAAKAFYADQLGLLESATLGGVGLAEFGVFLRNGNPTLCRALRFVSAGEGRNASFAA